MYNPFYHGLATVLVKSNQSFGRTWAWRIVRFLHAIPFYAGAWVFGYVACIVWGSVIPPVWGAWACAICVALLTARDWFKEWRRGY